MYLPYKMIEILNTKHNTNENKNETWTKKRKVKKKKFTTKVICDSVIYTINNINIIQKRIQSIVEDKC